MATELIHWKTWTNPAYLGAYAFQPDEVKIVTIKSVGQEMVQNRNGGKDECIVAHFEEDVKPLILNVTNCKEIQKLYKTGYVEEWVGKKISLVVKKVQAFGDIVDAVRVAPEIPDENTIICENCHAPIKPGAGHSAKEIANATMQQYGHHYCLKCVNEIKANSKKEN